jgi:hypothetical protein
MTDKPSDDERPDADAVFQRTLGNLVKTPPKPHKASGGEKKADEKPVRKP